MTHATTSLQPTPAYAEALSAFADNELDAAQTASLWQSTQLDSDFLLTWTSYQTIGDVLRANAQGAAQVLGTAQVADRATNTVNNAQTTVETTAQISAQTLSPGAAATGAALSQANRQLAANDSVFRWKLVAGMAAMVAVGSVVWSLAGTQALWGGSQMAQWGLNPASSGLSATAVLSSGAGQLMIRDPRLDELLAAHKQFGGASALQQPAGFLRNATFQPVGR